MASRPRKHSWLLKLYPPEHWYPREARGEDLLWWRAIRQAAQDIRRAPEAQALDAWEFIRSTGLWLLLERFHVPEEEAIRAVAALIKPNKERFRAPKSLL